MALVVFNVDFKEDLAAPAASDTEEGTEITPPRPPRAASRAAAQTLEEPSTARELRIEVRDEDSRKRVQGTVTLLQIAESGSVRKHAPLDGAAAIPNETEWLGFFAADYRLSLVGREEAVERASTAEDGIGIIYLSRASEVSGFVHNIPPSLLTDYSLEVRVNYDGQDIRKRVLASLPQPEKTVVEASGQFDFRRRIHEDSDVVLLARNRRTELTDVIAKKRLRAGEDYVSFDLTETPFQTPVGDIDVSLRFAGPWPHGDLQVSLVHLNRQKVRFKQIRGRRDKSDSEWHGTISDVREGIYSIELSFSDGCSALYTLEPFDVHGDTKVSYTIPLGATVRARMLGLEKCDFVFAPARVSAYSQSGVLVRSGYPMTLPEPVAILQGLPAGEYMLEAVAAGQGARSKMIQVEYGAEYLEEIVMVPAARAELHVSEADSPRLIQLSSPEFGNRLVKIAPGRTVGRIDVPVGLWEVNALWPGGPSTQIDVTAEGASATLRARAPDQPTLPTLVIAFPHGADDPDDHALRIGIGLRDAGLNLTVQTTQQDTPSDMPLLLWRPGSRSLAMRALPMIRQALGAQLGERITAEPRLFLDSDMRLELSNH